MRQAHPRIYDRLRLLGELVVFVWTLGVIVAAMSLDYRP